ncbi:MAG: glycosyltransferase family 4 protein [Chitinophagaceae bacterium]|nr:glycosyltransferase family 4 protein [Chitinophagaceae bacterium]
MINTNEKPLRILTWHIHGGYLYYLTQTPCIFFLPYKDGTEEGYGARTPSFPWGENVVSVPAENIKDLEFDCILFQSKKNYLQDQYEILSEDQRKLPKLYLEHDPPREVPTLTKHLVDDPEVLLVHVTHFNDLMWDNNGVTTRVIEHGVMVDPSIKYSGERAKGIVVINGIEKRGRRLGLDIFLQVREKIPLDIVGMHSENVGGLGEINNRELSRFMAGYRFFFNPIRYTSLGLSVCEAMMTGLPVIGLATTEMVVTIRNGYSGYIDTDVNTLIERMQHLLDDRDEAARLGEGAMKTAYEKFNIERFKQDWLSIFKTMALKHPETLKKRPHAL